MVRQVTNYKGLDRTFRALADPTRRQVLERLIRGPATVKELAKPFDKALPSFMQHLQVLEKSHLVRSEKAGWSRTVHLIPRQIEIAERWLRERRDVWEKRLDQLDAYVQELAKERSDE